MRRRLALNRMRAAALIGVLLVHGGMLYALAGVHIPTAQTEAKVLFVNIVDGSEATPGPASSSTPPSDSTRSRRAEKTEVTPVRRVPPKTTRARPLVKPPPADIAPNERIAQTPSAVDDTASLAGPPEGPREDGGSGRGDGDGAGAGSAGVGNGSGNGAGSGPGADGPLALTSELALVCPQRRPPPYPSVSRKLGESGRVVLRVQLDESGRVVEAHVVDSSGFARLDSAALAAVRSWRCTPARLDGHPVSAVALQPFDFKLDGF